MKVFAYLACAAALLAVSEAAKLTRKNVLPSPGTVLKLNSMLVMFVDISSDIPLDAKIACDLIMVSKVGNAVASATKCNYPKEPVTVKEFRARGGSANIIMTTSMLTRPDHAVQIHVWTERDQSVQVYSDKYTVGA